MNMVFNLNMRYEYLVYFVRELTLFLQTYIEDGVPKWLKPDPDYWKKLSIIETEDNVIFLGSNDEIPYIERSVDFQYIVTNFTKGSLAFTKGIVMIAYNHFNNVPVLIDIIIETLKKNGINEKDILKKGNTILLNNKKITGQFCKFRNGFTIECVFIIMNYDKSLMENGFNYSDDLIEYTGIKNLYPDFDEKIFYSDLQQEILKDKTEYVDTKNNTILNLINSDSKEIDINYEQEKQQYPIASIKISDAIKVITCRKIYELYEAYKIKYESSKEDSFYLDFIQKSIKKLEGYGFLGKTLDEQMNNFLKYNDEKTWESYKNSRPILGFCDLCEGNLDKNGNPTGPMCIDTVERVTFFGNRQKDFNCGDYKANEATDYIYFIAIHQASLPKNEQKIKKNGNILKSACPPNHGYYVDETLCKPNVLIPWRGIKVIDNYSHLNNNIKYEYYLSLDIITKAKSIFDNDDLFIDTNIKTNGVIK